MTNRSCPVEDVTMGIVRTIVSNFDVIAGAIVMLLYPLIASIRTIESRFKKDDEQWLTYWILYSFITLVELSFSKLIYWIPFWGTIKLLGVCWLVLPQFKGATFVYEYCVKKKLFRKEVDDNVRDGPDVNVRDGPDVKATLHRSYGR